MPIDEQAYAYGGARALVQLHERHLRDFVRMWRRAKGADLALPASQDPDTDSLGAMLRHVLGAARGYMVWICECLELPDPDIAAVPDDVEEALDAYVDHLLERWDGPLVELDQKTADRATFASRWGTVYCIDAMLEHAVMHPIRHALQLERALGSQAPHAAL